MASLAILGMDEDMIQQSEDNGGILGKCPCGCAELSQDQSTKRHVTIITVMAFIVTLGLVALNAWERSLHPDDTEIYSSGATQAAEHHHPAAQVQMPQHFQQHPGAQLQYAPIPGQHYAMVPQAAYPHQPLHGGLPAHAMIRTEELPSIMVVPVTNSAGVTRIKRVVSR